MVLKSSLMFPPIILHVPLMTLSVKGLNWNWNFKRGSPVTFFPLLLSLRALGLECPFLWMKWKKNKKTLTKDTHTDTNDRDLANIVISSGRRWQSPVYAESEQASLNITKVTQQQCGVSFVR